MKSIAPVFLWLCGRRAGAFLPPPPPSTTPASIVGRRPPRSCARLSLSLSAPPPPSSSIASSPFSWTSAARRLAPPSADVSILEPIGNGTFGAVYLARDEATGRRLVAKCARAATADDRARLSAASYLEVEAYVNSKLYPPRGDGSGAPHVAPYFGECRVNGTAYLLWEVSGEYTLEDYVEMDNGWVQLAADLGLTSEEGPGRDGSIGDGSESGMLDGKWRRRLHNRLAAEVLRQILEGVAYCHSCGIVHRDIKPANILVDPETHTLRIIDFGSACCMSSWSANKLGFKGSNKGPRSILYCAPEEFVDENHPYAFDIYGVAVTWIRTVLSDDRYEEDGGDADAANEGSGRGLADEDDLFKWRIAVRDFGHDLVAWEEYATLHGDSLPHGWDSLFGSSRDGIQALRLLGSMMSYAPGGRVGAAEALVGPYLNAGCDADPPPELPPAMPYNIASHLRRWKKDRDVHDGECRLEDLFTRVIAVELGGEEKCEWVGARGLILEPRAGAAGVRVKSVVDGTDAAKQELQAGDSLLAIGSIDVENEPIEHVMDILEQWAPNKPLPMLLVRDAD